MLKDIEKYCKNSRWCTKALHQREFCVFWYVFYKDYIRDILYSILKIVRLINR